MGCRWSELIQHRSCSSDQTAIRYPESVSRVRIPYPCAAIWIRNHGIPIESATNREMMKTERGGIDAAWNVLPSDRRCVDAMRGWRWRAGVCMGELSPCSSAGPSSPLRAFRQSSQGVSSALRATLNVPIVTCLCSIGGGATGARVVKCMLLRSTAVCKPPVWGRLVQPEKVNKLEMKLEIDQH